MAGARIRTRATTAARVVAFLIVLFGATVVPLSLEVAWRSQGNAALHVQPEVVVVEQAGARAAGGDDPYRVIDRHGHVILHQRAEPTYELYYPYLPGMVIFGLSSDAKGVPQLTDARIQFLAFTTVVGLFALSRLRPRTDARFRALQVLTVLPTAALPLATGGDDMPVVAMMLTGLVALQRRRPVLAGLALGVASSFKFTAWPLVVLALFVVRDRDDRRAVGRYLLGVVSICVPVVLPFAIRNAPAFVDNVIRFPLGLAGVSSPAASALPGHILIALLPGAHRAYVIVVAVVGGAALVWYLRRRPPADTAQLAWLTGWVMTIAIVVAPATRVGYLLYPINLFVWAWMLRRSDEPAQPVTEPSPAAPGVGAGAVGRSGIVVQLEQLDGEGSGAGGRGGRCHHPDLPVEAVTAAQLAQDLGARDPDPPGPRAGVDDPPTESGQKGAVDLDHLARRHLGGEGDGAVELALPLVDVDDVGDRAPGRHGQIADDVGRRLAGVHDGPHGHPRRGEPDGGPGHRDGAEGGGRAVPGCDGGGHHAGDHDEDGDAEHDEGRPADRGGAHVRLHRTDLGRPGRGVRSRFR